MELDKDFTDADASVMAPGYCDGVVARIMKFDRLSSRDFMLKRLVPVAGELTMGDAEKAKDFMKQLARLGFGKTEKGLTARSLIFIKNKKSALSKDCCKAAFGVSIKKGKKKK